MQRYQNYAQENPAQSVTQQSQSAKLDNSNQITEQDIQELSDYASEMDRKLYAERPPQPEDFGIKEKSRMKQKKDNRLLQILLEVLFSIWMILPLKSADYGGETPVRNAGTINNAL